MWEAKRRQSPIRSVQIRLCRNIQTGNSDGVQIGERFLHLRFIFVPAAQPGRGKFRGNSFEFRGRVAGGLRAQPRRKRAGTKNDKPSKTIDPGNRRPGLRKKFFDTDEKIEFIWASTLIHSLLGAQQAGGIQARYASSTNSIYNSDCTWNAANAKSDSGYSSGSYRLPRSQFLEEQPPGRSFLIRLSRKRHSSNSFSRAARLLAAAWFIVLET